MSEKVDVKILEQGDIFFFFRPKVSAKDIKSIEDVRRFYMVLSPEEEQKIIDDTNNNDTNPKEKKIYRLFIIGKKSLPEIRKTEARSSERFWAQVGGIFYDPQNLVEDQKELGIQKEASYIITVINPYKPVSEGYTTAEAERPKYPENIQKYLNKTDGKFIPLSENLTLINYQNAQIILIGAREGKDVIKQEIGLDIETEEGKENLSSADIFTKLKIRKEQVPIKPIIEGKFQ